jgi:hypothetical protein
VSSYFGYASALFWILSCAAWAWSAAVPSPIKQAPEGQPDAIIWNDDPAIGMSFNGMKLPNVDDFMRYQRTVLTRNITAAALSAVGAIFAAISIAAL